MAQIEITTTSRKQTKTDTTHETFYETETIPGQYPGSRTQTWRTEASGAKSPASVTSGGGEVNIQMRSSFSPTGNQFYNSYMTEETDGGGDLTIIRRPTRNTRLRESLFPEGQLNQLGQHIPGAKLTAVQRLSGAAQAYKHVILSIVNYQEDCDAAKIGNTELARLLANHNDPDGQQKAIHFIMQLCKKHASRYGLAASDELLRALVKLLEMTTDTDTLRLILAVLYYLSACDQGANTLVRFLAIPLLVRLLGHELTDVGNSAASILHNILLLVESSKPIVKQCEGERRMAELIMKPQMRIDILIDCLRLLAHNDQETKLVLLHLGTPRELVQIMQNYNHEKLLFVTSRLLKVLSGSTELKLPIVNAGGVPAFERHLTNPISARLTLSCLWALRNVSDQAYHLTTIDNLIRVLVVLLADSNNHVSTCAAGCLCNFTSQNPHNKRIVVQSGGVEALCRAMEKHIDREEMTEPLSCALRHVTHRHELSVAAQQKCQQVHGVHMVAKLVLNMHQQALGGVAMGDRLSIASISSFSWPLLKALLGLLRNLALLDGNRVILRELGVVPVICNSLLRAYTGAQEIARQRGSVVSMQSELSYVDGVRLEDMCELSLAALQAFARDPQCKQIIIQSPDLLSITVQILYHPSEFLQAASTSLLCELALDGKAAVMIEQEGATSRLTQLLHSSDATVATYSAACLFRLAQDKPPEFLARLTEELQQSLLDANVVKPADVNVNLTTVETKTHEEYTRSLKADSVNGGVGALGVSTGARTNSRLGAIASPPPIGGYSKHSTLRSMDQPIAFHAEIGSVQGGRATSRQSIESPYLVHSDRMSFLMGDYDDYNDHGQGYGANGQVNLAYEYNAGTQRSNQPQAYEELEVVQPGRTSRQSYGQRQLVGV